jgi:ankyrin repeat protein
MKRCSKAAFARNAQDLYAKSQLEYKKRQKTHSILSVVQSKDANALNKLLRNGADLSTRSDDGKTALHLATIANKIDNVRRLIDSGIDVTSIDNDGCLSIHHAASRGHADILQILGSLASNLDIVNNAGDTPLHLAASQGHSKCISLLVEMGATIKLLNYQCLSCLHVAMAGGHAKVVQMLLQRGAELCPDSCDIRTILKLSIQGGAEITDLLIANMASRVAELLLDGELRNYISQRLNKSLVKVFQKYNFYIPETGDQTSMQISDIHPAEDATVNSADQTLLKLQRAWKLNLEQLVSAEMTESLKYLFVKGNSWGKTSALKKAVELGKLEIIQLLLERGADANAGGILRQAVMTGKLEIIQLLLERGADINSGSGN